MTVVFFATGGLSNERPVGMGARIFLRLVQSLATKIVGGPHMKPSRSNLSPKGLVCGLPHRAFWNPSCSPTNNEFIQEITHA